MLMHMSGLYTKVRDLSQQFVYLRDESHSFGRRVFGIAGDVQLVPVIPKLTTEAQNTTKPVLCEVGIFPNTAKEVLFGLRIRISPGVLNEDRPTNFVGIQGSSPVRFVRSKLSSMKVMMCSAGVL
jgi:hypothetical protein